MKKSFFILITLLIPFYLFSGEGDHFYNMSNKQIDSLLAELNLKVFTITEKMDMLSAYFLGTPYDFKCVGDGPYALMED